MLTQCLFVVVEEPVSFGGERNHIENLVQLLDHIFVFYVFPVLQNENINEDSEFFWKLVHFGERALELQPRTVDNGFVFLEALVANRHNMLLELHDVFDLFCLARSVVCLLFFFLLHVVPY